MMVGQVDDEVDNEIDWSEIKAEPLPKMSIKEI